MRRMSRVLFFLRAVGIAALALAAPPISAQAACPQIMHLYVAGSGGGQAPNEALRNELERGLGDVADRAVKYPAVDSATWTAFSPPSASGVSTTTVSLPGNANFAG